VKVHRHTWDHHASDSAYQRFNKHVAIKVTNGVGSMTCAWVFCITALISLPAILTEALHLTIFPGWMIAPGLILVVAWVAQTFIQLVLLSVIMVGQNVQQEASDARAVKTFDDTELVVDRLNIETEGGIEVLNGKLDKLLELLGKGKL
jgi:uncharacterized membrane protein